MMVAENGTVECLKDAHWTIGSLHLETEVSAWNGLPDRYVLTTVR